jgi:hypothetical protein
MSKKVTDRLRKMLSRKVTGRFRRSDANDKQTIRKLQQFEIPGASASGPPSVGIFSPPIPPPSSTPPPSRSHDNDNALAVWENGGYRVKLLLANEALAFAWGRPVSWTLNLSPDRVEEAQRDPRGFTESFSRDLNRALKRALGRKPPYWFSVDVANKPSDRLHLQGGVAVSDNELGAVSVAMLHVGGDWASTRFKDRQLHLNPDRCDHGWALYSLRNRRRVSGLIRGRTFSVTGPLRSEAKALYDEYRRIMRGA